MEKEFVPENLVEKLKELGYNGPIIISYILFGEYKPKVDVIQRITFSQVFRWFREKYDYIGFIYQPNETGYWAYSLEDKAKYDTYEEAELACLDKLIEIVEQTERIEHGVYR